MKVTIEQKPALNAIKLHAAHCRGKATLPILSTCLVQSCIAGIQYTSTDLDSWLNTRRVERVENPGETCVIAKRFSECLASCKNSVELETVSTGKTIVDKKEVENFNLAVRNGSLFSLPTLPAVEFPPMPQIEKPVAGFRVAANVLHHALNRVAFAMSTDETRYVLNGVYFEFKNAGTMENPAPVLNLVSTDGRRLAVQEMQGASFQVLFDKSHTDYGFIVPAAAVTMFLKMAKGETGNVSVNFGTAKTHAELVQFEFARKDETIVRYVSKQVEGNYVNYRQVMPDLAQSKSVVCFDRAQFAAAAETCEQSTTEKQNAANLEFSASNCRMWIKTDAGEACIDLPVSANGSKLVERIAFNPGYLLEAAEAIDDCEMLTMSLVDFESPCVIHIPFFKCVIMPMRFSDKTAPKTAVKIEPKSETVKPEPVAQAEQPVESKPAEVASVPMVQVAGESPTVEDKLAEDSPGYAVSQSGAAESPHSIVTTDSDGHRPALQAGTPLAELLGYNRAKQRMGYGHPANYEPAWTPENDIVPIGSFENPAAQIPQYKIGIAKALAAIREMKRAESVDCGRLVLPVADVYGELIAAVNAGNMERARECAARIGADANCAN